jgi:flagellar L-ring protein precursor FlgH
MKALLTCAVLMLAACASRPVAPDPMPEAELPPLPQAQPGAIYNGGIAMDWFADTRARDVGDVLTVLLVEQTQAQTSSATSTGKSSSASLTGPTVFGRPITRNGVEIFSGSLGGDRSFEGGGDSTQSNRLTGALSVRVIERDARGLLRVAGRKQLALNRGDEMLELSGWVRPEDINPDNTVRSDRVASAQVKYSGRGALGDANAQGWLSRFFNSPLFPF